MNLDDSVETLLRQNKVTRLAGLKRLNIETIKDLIYHLPSRYEKEGTDSIKNIKKGDTVAITGTITSLNMRKSMGKRRVMMATASIKNQDGTIKATWFSQPYIAKMFSKGDNVYVQGKVSGDKDPYLSNPKMEQSKAQLDENLFQLEGRLNPIYPETKNISSLFITSLVQKVLESITEYPDPIPEQIREELNLPTLKDAIHFIHNPRNEQEYTASKKRFAFEYMYLLQVRHQKLQKERKSSKAYSIAVDTKDTDKFIKTQFPFTPTKDQIKVTHEILKDIEKNEPMARLLQGDVGSGKTAVAAAVMYSIITATPEEKTSGRPQVAYLAPTDVLARQQFLSLVELFKNLPINIGYISGKECLKFPSKVNPETYTNISKPQLKKWIDSGEIAVAVGTHALIQKDVSFKRLALVVIDEQHRFGVAQRQVLFSKTNTHIPHLLSMTATPIPRTFALTIYGDLQFSTIRELPKGRKPVETYFLKEKDINTALDHVRKEIDAGHQAYILCPRVEESDKLNIQSVESVYKTLSTTTFKDKKVAMLHGQMKPKTKIETIESFKQGEIDILISTTVIEVGVNIPNATIITILNGERFGLAQLHQLRGRVQRSTHKSYCYVISNSTHEITKNRLSFFQKTYDGFKLAEKDFDTRDGGDLLGTRQSGSFFFPVSIENINIHKLTELAQKKAEETINDLDSYPILQKAIEDAGKHHIE